MKVYTRTGDSGTTSHTTFGRIAKSSIEVEVSGLFDNALSFVGFAREECARKAHEGGENQAGWEALERDLKRAQQRLFTAAACLFNASATSSPLFEGDIIELEKRIDELDALLPGLDAFILPGGSEANARLNLARCAVRDVERGANRARDSHLDGPAEEQVNLICLTYLNRLSDALFVFGRYALALESAQPIKWEARS